MTEVYDFLIFVGLFFVIVILLMIFVVYALPWISAISYLNDVRAKRWRDEKYTEEFKEPKV